MNKRDRKLLDAYERGFALQQEYLGSDKPVNRIEPVVSVCTITYQHAPFIRQCLDSILMQETNFPWEFIIGEDGSTDGTRETCIEYAEQHPDRIRLFLRDRSLSQYPEGDRTFRFNGLWARRSARGQYIALCEGDDYWTDPKKLQKQVEVFRRFPDCVICGGRVLEWRDGEDAPYATRPDWDSANLQNLNAYDIFYGRVSMRTCTRMLPRAILFELPMRLSFDWGMTMFALSRSNFGRVLCLDDVVAVYREHPGGIFSSLPYTQRLEEQLDALHRFLPFFSGEHRRFLHEKISDTLRLLCTRQDVPTLRRLKYQIQANLRSNSADTRRAFFARQGHRFLRIPNAILRRLGVASKS